MHLRRGMFVIYSHTWEFLLTVAWCTHLKATWEGLRSLIRTLGLSQSKSCTTCTLSYPRVQPRIKTPVLPPRRMQFFLHITWTHGQLFLWDLLRIFLMNRKFSFSLFFCHQSAGDGSVWTKHYFQWFNLIFIPLFSCCWLFPAVIFGQ